ERLQDERDDEQSSHQHRRQRGQKLDRGLARLFFRLVFLLRHSLGHSTFLGSGAISALSNYSKRTVPPGHLEQMGGRIGEVNEFITGTGGSRHVLGSVSNRPVDQQ